MTPSHPIVFLVDVDNTLVDNDGIQQDLKDHLERTYGLAARERYWRILEDLFVELGYRDYIGALQRFRVEHRPAAVLAGFDRGHLRGLGDGLGQPPGVVADLHRCHTSTSRS